MKLSSLNQNFHLLPPNEQAIFFNQYYNKRKKDLEMVIIKLQSKKRKATGTSKRKGKKIPVTVEQLELLKKLGLI